MILPLGASLILAGCAQTNVLLQTDKLKPIPTHTRVLLMPTDIELSEVTAGGLLEPKAEWTNRATAHVIEAIQKELAQRNDIAITYREPEDASAKHRHHQLIKLHAAVGQTIILHKIHARQNAPAIELPTKKGKFDWGLGSGAAALRQDDTDFGLFVYIRDSYTSAGRAAVIFAAALLRVGLPGGSLLGFASLVDLKTGEIVWFNLLATGTGDLRSAEPAQRAITQLLKDLPL